VRRIAEVLALSWAPAELRPYYSPIGRPSIHPVLMIRMLIIGFVFEDRQRRSLADDDGRGLSPDWHSSRAGHPYD
jgi:hypothetical protein